MTSRRSTKVTERDIEVLRGLVFAYDTLLSLEISQGARPLDCGGTNGSDHSYRLSKLVRLGLAEERKRGFPWGKSPKNFRGSKLYRPTKVGRDLCSGRRSSEPVVSATHHG